MSRLKGVDLGITNPSLTSLGAMKGSSGAGLPTFTGRNPNDVHYDSAAKVFYYLTGAAGTAVTETFTKTAASNLVGQNTDSGGKTWIAVNVGAGNNNSAVVNADGTGGVGGVSGVFYAAGYAGMPTTGRSLSVDVVTTAAAITAANVNDTAVFDIGDTASNTQSTGPITVTIKPGVQRLTVLIDGATVPVNNATFASLGIPTGQTKHTLVIELHNDKTYIVTVDGVTVASGSYTRAIGPVDAFWLTAGSAVSAVEIDNWVDTAQGTLAWSSLVGSAPLNYRGEWSAAPSPAYAANDLVTRNGVVYVASNSPSANDPATSALIPIATTPSAGVTAVPVANAASSFTVSSPTWVYAMKWYSTAASAGSQTVGIATAVSATPTFIAKGSSHAGVTGWDTVPFTTPVLLLPGTTYYAVIMTETTVGQTSTGGGTYGVVTVANGINRGPTLGTIASPGQLVFELDDQYWRPLGLTSALNYRGQWSASPTPAYAVNDLVTRNGLAYVASVAPGATDPVGAVIALGAVTGSSPVGTSSTGAVAQAFQVSSAVSVSQVKFRMNGTSTAGRLAGIASALVGISATYLASGTTTATTSGNYDTVVLNKSVTLVPGVTYYAVYEDNQWAQIGGGNGTATGVLVSNIVGAAGPFYIAAGAWQGGGGTFPNGSMFFEIDGNPWMALGPTSALNYRGPWSATSAYAANDLVTRNGLAYTASVTPGSADPVGGSAALGGSTSAGAASYWGQQSAQAFTPTQSITVSGVTLLAGTGGGSMTSGTVSITPDYAQGAAVPTALASVATGAQAQGTSATYTFPTPVTLLAGVTYRLVVTDSTVSAKPSATATGAITLGSVLVGSAGGPPNASTFTTSWTMFTLVGNPWTPLAALAENVNVVAASGAAVTLPDVTTATMHRVTLTAATPAITLPAPGAGKSFTVELVQDATGGRAPTWATPSGAIRWPGGAAPTITATANAIDVITFVCIGGANWYGFIAGQAFA